MSHRNTECSRVGPSINILDNLADGLSVDHGRSLIEAGRGVLARPDTLNEIAKQTNLQRCTFRGG